MNVSLYQAAAAMNANLRWQETISDNLSAGSVPGFKKQDLSFAAVQAGLLSSAQNLSGGLAERYVLPLALTATNFQQGELKATGNTLDLAIEGGGFFEVQMPDGSRAYTRNGEFRLNAQGQLATREGFLVLGDAGPFQFDLNNAAPITIALQGQVSQGADRKGVVKLVEFNDQRLLQPVGAGYFLANDPNLQGAHASTATVRQGFLESANLSTVSEMGNLITSLRMFEANQRVIQAHDERLGRVINDLGNPS